VPLNRARQQAGAVRRHTTLRRDIPSNVQKKMSQTIATIATPATHGAEVPGGVIRLIQALKEVSMPAWSRAVLCVPIVAISLVAANSFCDPNPDAQAALDQLSEKSRDVKYSERLAYQRKTLEDLLRKYPGEMIVERRYVDVFKYDVPEELPALQRQYREKAARNPNDPAALYVAGLTLQGRDTPEAIRLMEKAQTLEPAFAWPYLSLANTYGSGKFGDTKSAEYIACYFRACPEGSYFFGISLLNRFCAPELQATVAADQP
jgi:hypothetical protein